MIVKSKKLITLSLSVIDDLRIKLIIVLYTFYTLQNQYQFGNIIMKQEFIKSQNSITPIHHLHLVYNYYCKLNDGKMKHTNFDEVNSKVKMMDLHEFMTLCKDFQITEKKKKINTSRIDQLHQAVENKSEHQRKLAPTFQDGQRDKDSKQSTETMPNKPKDFNQNPSCPKQPKKEIIQYRMPDRYINQRKIATIFKKEITPEGRINFQSFVKILTNISNLVYIQDNQTIPQLQQKQLASEKSSNIRPSQKQQQEDKYLLNLLNFMRLNSKDNFIDVFKKINEMHGKKEYLALMRQPIKKLHLKNDPLGNYVHSSQTKLLGKSKANEKVCNLPKVSKDRLYQYSKNPNQKIKQISKQVQKFINSNQPQISILNKSYLQSYQKNNILKSSNLNGQFSRVKFDNNTLVENTVRNERPKKYSQRHKDKVMSDISYKQIGNLIDASTLYDDEIFNKYVTLNYKNDRSNSNLIKSRML